MQIAIIATVSQGDVAKVLFKKIDKKPSSLNLNIKKNIPNLNM